jgi:hypothetical protein
MEKTEELEKRVKALEGAVQQLLAGLISAIQDVAPNLNPAGSTSDFKTFKALDTLSKELAEIAQRI